MATYIGVRVNGDCHVYRLDPPDCSKLSWRLELRSHSPCGLEWGYSGSGPAQLALAIVHDVTQDHEVALLLYQRFKFDVVKLLPRAGWIIESEFVDEWIMRQLDLDPAIEDKITGLPEGF